MTYRPAGRLRHSVAFDVAVKADDGLGGSVVTWTLGDPEPAEITFDAGREALQADALTGTAVSRVVVRSHAATRAITTAYRMRNLRTDVAFNVREVDPDTDPDWVFIRVEAGVAI